MIALYIAIVIVMTAMGSLGAIYFKRATEKTEGVTGLIKNKWFYLGALLYILASFMTIYLLQTIDVSIILPLTAVTYIWTVIFGYIFFKDDINRQKIAAIGLIIIGAVLITVS